MAHTCNLSIRDAEAGEYPGKPRIKHQKTMTQKTKQINIKQAISCANNSLDASEVAHRVGKEAYHEVHLLEFDSTEPVF